MKGKAVVFSTGLAMFSMFFGSGNLVFPILVGQMSQGHYLLAALGIILTGVLVPFLGILAMLFFKGKTEEFFSLLGKYAPFWLSLICLSIMGPFGVLARCITVAHGAFQLIAPSTPLWVFSLTGCCAVFLLTVKKNRIVPMLGSILTPFLLASLAAITICGLFSTNLPIASQAEEGFSSFQTGIFQGYQTMDLLAAFFFSTFIIHHLQKHADPETSPSRIISVFFRSSLLGAGLLSLVYAALVLLGSMYAPQLALVAPQEMLGVIAKQSLGPLAAPLVCGCIILACLTTAIVLTSLFADFLRKEISQKKLPHAPSLLLTLGFAFFTSTLEFSGIARYIGPLLEVMYPAFIVLAVLGIFHKLWGWKAVRTPFAAALAIKVLSTL
ncbi:MAG: branched-chain amino acid transport system II carrier protein [Chlamydiales bacterium]|nr:branched-chain amino acid transport system II carrier protein [Chlamydiales bacterium]